MDAYYDCPCGHRHSQHNWHCGGSPETFSHCLVAGCPCWTYHGHRVGDEPHYVVRERLVNPTEEMYNRGLTVLALRLAGEQHP